MPEVQTKSHNANSGGGNKQGAFKDKDKPTEIRMSNITAAKGEQVPINFNMLGMMAYKESVVFLSCCRCHTNESWTERDGQNGEPCFVHFVGVTSLYIFCKFVFLYILSI